jgi:hypothetical protein
MKPLCQILGDIFFTQEPQRQLRALLVQLQFVLDRFQGMVADNDIDGSIGANDKQPCWFSPPRHHRQPIQRGHIAPLEIFQPEY